MLRPKRAILKHFAGLVPMDRARQDWVHEHAETGKRLRPRDEDISPGTTVPLPA